MWTSSLATSWMAPSIGERERRWKETTLQWPRVSAVFDGVTRDQLMTRHRANHVYIAHATHNVRAQKEIAESWIAQRPMKGSSKILRVKPEWTWLALIEDLTISCDEIHAVGPCGVGDLNLVVEAIDNSRKLDA
jgi:hypothetical protein